MDLFDAVEARCSVRSYLPDAVPEEKLMRIMEAARLAPSAGNIQEWRFVIVIDPEKRQALAEAANGQQFLAQAPVVIVACAETDEATMPCGHLKYTIDLAIALEHIALAATAEGLGTCWIGAFSEDAARQVIGAPEQIRIVELMPLGYPDAAPSSKNRKPMSEILMFDQWGQH